MYKPEDCKCYRVKGLYYLVCIFMIFISSLTGGLSATNFHFLAYYIIFLAIVLSRTQIGQRIGTYCDFVSNWAPVHSCISSLVTLCLDSIICWYLHHLLNYIFGLRFMTLFFLVYGVMFLFPHCQTIWDAFSRAFAPSLLTQWSWILIPFLDLVHLDIGVSPLHSCVIFFIVYIYWWFLLSYLGLHNASPIGFLSLIVTLPPWLHLLRDS